MEGGAGASSDHRAVSEAPRGPRIAHGCDAVHNHTGLDKNGTTPESSRGASPKKAKYRVTNWPAYDRALVGRGDITFWFEQAGILQNWTPEPTGQRGAPVRDSDGSIQTLLVLKEVFHLPYRALEGFGRSLMRLMGLDLPVPDHTHLSRRVAGWWSKFPAARTRGRSMWWRTRPG